MTGCQGEQVSETFEVYIEDEEGNVHVDKKMETLENGFIDLWLPREKSYNGKIANDEVETTGEISTFAGDNTCITTMQLS
nr:CueP family metal-binding protein [Salisediminibacterium halotolerans]